eukprot:5359137-Pleurochrysis_carterae.AAC.1
MTLGTIGLSRGPYRLLGLFLFRTLPLPFSLSTLYLSPNLPPSSFSRLPSSPFLFTLFTLSLPFPFPPLPFPLSFFFDWAQSRPVRRVLVGCSQPSGVCMRAGVRAGLAPGASATVAFTLRGHDLALTDAEARHRMHGTTPNPYFDVLDWLPSAPGRPSLPSLR